MSNNINIFEKILLRFRFKEYIPLEVKKFILQNRVNGLILTLKSFSDYNIVYGLVIRIYFLFSRFGLSITVAQSKVVLAIISVFTLITLSTGIIFSFNIIITGDPDPGIGEIRSVIQKHQTRKTVLNPVVNNNENTVIERIFKENDEDIKFRLGVKLFSAKNVDDDTISLVTDNVSDELLSILGNKKVIDLRKDRKEKNVNRMLLGSVGRIGEKIIISVKVVNVENSRVLFGITEKINSVDEMNNTCKKIAKKVAGKIE